MERRYREYKQLDLTATGREIREFWQEQGTFHQSLELREDARHFIFYEGPPSANGMPGIHHVMARVIKDIFCRYKTQKGYLVERKAGWDTHGLPVEIAVEKMLGITKEDIGKSISVEEYNSACRREVLKYKDVWDELTEEMGYWVDLDKPYITFDNKYIESVWWLLKQLYNKDLLYKGYTIQPYSPAAGTGLSTHELNQPGCYRDVKDNSLTAQFKVIRDQRSEFLFSLTEHEVFILAWTTTPWTLPSNTALAVGKDIPYVMVDTYNPYTYRKVSVILAKDLMPGYFPAEQGQLPFDDYKEGDKKIPWRMVGQWKGSALAGMRYEQLLPYARPTDGDAFVVVTGDFVSTEDGTGIVHIAPSFGADDFRTARQFGLGSLTLVDSQGRFTPDMGEFAGRYVKNEYYADDDPAKAANNVDVDIIIKLKYENRAFRSEKYEHSYPHCWRTDKPILYYPLDSWFVRTTAYKDRLIALNKTIDWKPEFTGTGRFGNWLDNLVDWNLSRSRYWGIPLPVWSTEDGTERCCIGSLEELKEEIAKAVKAGYMPSNPLEKFVPGDFSESNYQVFDLHRPVVDDVILLSPSGRKMMRESDLIDVWFDSGSMPYAQFHYPFERKEALDTFFPADFIAEGVDQTRGWFYTLHAIATLVFDSVAFKTVVSNGLVLDKNGEKMSKKKGNSVDPFEIIRKYGPDPTRWYMITNSQPWDNLKFDEDAVGEVQRKFFGTLFNTYAFFALYANIDGFTYLEEDIPFEQRPEIDRWILSELNTLIIKVDQYYQDYEPTWAGRAVQDFVYDYLSNWYVRLTRRRFWKGNYSADKISAFQTLYTCLETVARLAAPIAPFFTERMFLDLNGVSGKCPAGSVHLASFPQAVSAHIDKGLEERMELAQQYSSMILSLRKKTNLKVRQPLNKVMIPVPDLPFENQLRAVEHLILSETNIKEAEYLHPDKPILVKKVKPNFKELGPRYGKLMKSISQQLAALTQAEIQQLEREGFLRLGLDGTPLELKLQDVEILTEDIPGWVVTSQGSLTVALDVTLTEELVREGIARELVNRIQNIRKNKDFEVTDKIELTVESHPEIISAIRQFNSYICSETLACRLQMVDRLSDEDREMVELTDQCTVHVKVSRVQ
ncbi:MAG TPA: isoleucine--tRNA ligase [Bacteroidales bacterium]|nr:isoleucine--tRNA ligase [Bacteroidales bacterium]HSA44594.1 isoleucine--tRNA ligase [Bacteroidales bacterium]